MLLAKNVANGYYQHLASFEGSLEAHEIPCTLMGTLGSQGERELNLKGDKRERIGRTEKRGYRRTKFALVYKRKKDFEVSGERQIYRKDKKKYYIKEKK